MTEIVINRCFGGFGLSPAAVEEYLRRKGKPCYWYTDARDDEGRLSLRAPKVRLPETPDNGMFIAYSYTKDDPDAEDAYFYHADIDRDDPDLVAVVREMGEKADGNFAELAIVEIPDGVEWEIDEYDGNEQVAETHRTWR